MCSLCSWPRSLIPNLLVESNKRTPNEQNMRDTNTLMREIQAKAPVAYWFPHPKRCVWILKLWCAKKGLQLDILAGAQWYLCFLLLRRRRKLLLRDKLPRDVPWWNSGAGLYCQNETTKDGQLFSSHGHGSYLYNKYLPVGLSISVLWSDVSISVAISNKHCW